MPASPALTDAVLNGRWLSLSAAARRVGVHAATLGRWAAKGILGRDGRVHRLATVRVGGRVATTPEDVGSFLAALSAADANDAPPVRSAVQRNRSHDAADHELRDRGL